MFSLRFCIDDEATMTLSVPVAFQYPDAAALFGLAPFGYFRSRGLKKYHSFSPKAATADQRMKTTKWTSASFAKIYFHNNAIKQFINCSPFYGTSLFRWTETWQVPRIKFVDINFCNDRGGERDRGCLLLEIMEDEFFISRMEPKTWGQGCLRVRHGYTTQGSICIKGI